ncbi:hypothetical protein ACFFWD_03260 [Bradyrhizobium erythrophlei]|uniref:hypothetical protein n=1 Tax=Bradyrhizobium erythrophlei TaxID=1437360 RepID=UPI0035EEB495
MPMTRRQGITNRSKAKSKNARNRSPTPSFSVKSNPLARQLLPIYQAHLHSSHSVIAAEAFLRTRGSVGSTSVDYRKEQRYEAVRWSGHLYGRNQHLRFWTKLRRDTRRLRATNPGAIAKLLRRHAGNAERIVFETGSLSNWLWHQLRALAFPVICLDACHANAALSMRFNKSDQNDAKGLAEMARMGWYREAAVKGAESWKTRSMLGGSNQAGESAARY